MQNLNEWLHKLANNYVLISIGAILFFVIKGIIGYRSYKHYDRKLKTLEMKLNDLSSRLKK